MSKSASKIAGRPRELYVVHQEGNLYKLGKSFDPEKNLRQLQRGNPHKLSLGIRVICKDVDELETRIKDEFKQFATDGGTEWRKLSKKQLGELNARIGQLCHEINNRVDLTPKAPKASTTIGNYDNHYIPGKIPDAALTIAKAIERLGRSPSGYTEDQLIAECTKMREEGLHTFLLGFTTNGEPGNIRNRLQRNWGGSRIYKETWGPKNGYAAIFVQAEAKPPHWTLVKGFETRKLLPPLNAIMHATAVVQRY